MMNDCVDEKLVCMDVVEQLEVFYRTSAYIDTKILHVVDSGMKKFGKDDMMVVFFVAIEHRGNKPRKVMVTVNECCEDISDNERDCNAIDLHGGYFGVLQPGKVKNLSLIYPNLYGYDRKGHCLVTILYRTVGTPEVAELSHEISFDTRISDIYIPQLDGLYNPKKVVICDSPDMDPLNYCNPVSCNLKYSGFRNYFNWKLKLCQRASVCHTNLKKELPDVVYVPTSNECRNLEREFTKEEVDKILLQHYHAEPMVNVRCHHGVINPKTGFCVCDRGWKSQPYDPNLVIYSMCTIKCMKEKPIKALCFLGGVAVAFFTALLVCCCEVFDVFLVKKNASTRSSEEEMFIYSVKDSGQGSQENDACD